MSVTRSWSVWLFLAAMKIGWNILMQFLALLPSSSQQPEANFGGIDEHRWSPANYNFYTLCNFPPSSWRSTCTIVFTVTFSTFCRRKLCKIWYCLPFAGIFTCYGFCIYQFLWACFIDYGSRSCPQCPREKGFCCGNSLTGSVCPKAFCPSPLPTSLPIFSNNFLLWSRLNPSSLILKDQVANASSMSSSFGRGPELRSVRNNSWS